MTEKTLTTENIKPALDALRGELAPWPVVAKKQDRLNTAQLNAANSGITSSLVAQIIANTAAIRALESAITGTGLRALVVSSLPAVGTTGILYIVPVTTYDPDTDADVVNYSNEYIWIPVEGGTDSEGHYEQVGQTGIVINNGQLNITVNGTSVGTFTANQSGDTTAAITVPTNADYVDRTTDQTVAGVKTFSSTIIGTAAKAIADEDGTSIKTGYVNIAGNQTVSGNKEFTGSNTFNNILPNATNTYSLGSSSYQWSSVYAQSYYYNGTAWGLNKANTWTETNTFTGRTFYTGIYDKFQTTAFDVRTDPESTRGGDIFRFWSGTGSTYGDYLGGMSFYQSTDGSLTLQLICFGYPTTGNAKQNRINLHSFRDGTSSFYPVQTSSINLGTSTNKWKTLNGVNPGALSLPDGANSINVGGSILPNGGTATALDGSANYFTPTITGWLSLAINSCSDLSVWASSMTYGQRTTAPSTGQNLQVMLPVFAGQTYEIRIIGSSILTARLFPCLGNV